MKMTLRSLFAISLLVLVNTSSHALSDDEELMLDSYLPKLQQTWMEVTPVKDMMAGKYIRPREYVAVTNLDKDTHGIITLHIRKDFPDDSQGYGSVVNSYFVDCRHGRQRYIGVTLYDKSGNEIDSKFADKLNEVEDSLNFAESPQGHYCSGELILKLLQGGSFLSANDQAIFDKALQESRDHQIQAIQDKNLGIPKVDIAKYQLLVEQEHLEKAK